MTVNLDVVLDSFVARVPEALHAVAMSTDGHVVATSSALPACYRQQLATVGANLVTLLHDAATSLESGRLVSHIAHMDGGFMFTMRLSPQVSLVVIASTDCDVAEVGRELPQLTSWFSPDCPELRATPQARAQHGPNVAAVRHLQS